MAEIVEKELSFQINGACFRVQNQHGRFLTEKQYCDALAIELEKVSISFIREPQLKISYNGKEMFVGRPDFVIEDKIILDAKAKKFITKQDYYQMMKYLGLLDKHLGMIVNFRSSHLKPKRVLNPSFHSRHSSGNSNHSSRSKGFTLIEAIVSVSVFAVAVSGTVGAYLAVQRLNSESIALNAVQQNGRFILEDLTKLIRNGQVNYDRYINVYGSGGVPQPSTANLYLIDADGERINVVKSGTGLFLTRGVVTTNYSGTEVEVLDFRVFIWPSQDPYSGGPNNQKPAVTVFLRLRSQITPRDTVTIPFQTTVATRQYPE